MRSLRPLLLGSLLPSLACNPWPPDGLDPPGPPSPQAPQARVSGDAGPPSSAPFKLMTYNIDRGGVSAHWLDVLEEEDPDVAVLVEVGDFDDNGESKLTAVIDELDAHFQRSPPYEGDVTRGTTVTNTGVAILSRFPIVSSEQLDWLTLDDGVRLRPAHPLMIWAVDVSGRVLHIAGVYLKCCPGQDNETRRELAIEGLLNRLDDLGDVPLVLAGDFNSFSPADVGPLAPRGDLGQGPLELLLSHGFRDVFRELDPLAPGYTYGHLDPSLGGRLDYLLVNEPAFPWVRGPSSVGDTPSAEHGSDHFSVDATFAAP